VFEYNTTGGRGVETTTSHWPVFRDHQHRILPSDHLAIGCCVFANDTRDYGTLAKRNTNSVYFEMQQLILLENRNDAIFNST